jgi:hypothetical protein
MEAYLDIETTGLSPSIHKVTVVGISIGDRDHIVQLVGNGITADGLRRALEQATTIYTYNGTRFDLPFLRLHFGIDLCKHFRHHDLMLDCWERNLYGGLKSVGNRLGLSRKSRSIDGLEAIRLWNRYDRFCDYNALRVLLDYNKEDVLALRALREVLIKQHPQSSRQLT